VSGSLAATTTAYALGLAAWIALRALRGRDRSGQAGALVVLQGALTLQALLVAARWLRGGGGPAEPLVFAGYLALSLLLLPLGWVVCHEDPGPWSSVRLTVAALAVAVVTLRMRTTWGPGGA
jgi:hypothetical protein